MPRKNPYGTRLQIRNNEVLSAFFSRLFFLIQGTMIVYAYVMLMRQFFAQRNYEILEFLEKNTFPTFHTHEIAKRNPMY